MLGKRFPFLPLDTGVQKLLVSAGFTAAAKKFVSLGKADRYKSPTMFD